MIDLTTSGQDITGKVSNVVDISDFRQKRPEMVWTHLENCPDKGQTFYLHSGGTIECAACHRRITGRKWVETV